MTEATTQPKWEIVRVPNFSGGLNLDSAPEDLQPNELLEAKNVQFYNGYLRSVPGYDTFADTFRGEGQLLAYVTFQDKTSELLLLTTLTFYKLVGTQWQYMSNGTSTTTSASAAAGATSVTVVDITGFSDNEYIGIILDNGTQHKTQVNGAPSGSTITFDDAIPVGRSVANGAIVVEAAALTGDVDIPADYCVLVDQAKVVFTNGVDKVKIYNRTTFINATGTPSAANTLARCCIAWNNRCFLAHTTEGGTTYPQRIRWCATGDVTDWSGADTGHIDLWDREDQIIGLALLNGQLQVVREYIVERGTYVGEADRLVVYEPVADGEGAFAKNTIVTEPESLTFMGHRDFYRYRGIAALESRGSKIARSILSIDGELAPNVNTRAFHVVNLERGCTMFFIPSAVDNNPQNAMILNENNGAWTRREFAHNFTCAAPYASSTQLTWDIAPGNWEAYGQDWSSRSLSANSETLLLGGHNGSVGQVYEVDFIENTDDGTAIPWSFTTKDFLYPNANLRVAKIEFVYAGPVGLADYSDDGGITWSAFGAIPQTADRTVVKLHRNAIAERIRFRFSATGGTFLFGMLVLTVQPSEPHV